MKKHTRICFYGGPGLGKSTIALNLCGDLKTFWNKRSDPQVELVIEAIKEWAWLGIKPESEDQYYIFAKQTRSEDIILRLKKISVITDSPIPMQLAYMGRDKLPYLNNCVEKALLWEKQNPGLHILLKRTLPYQQEGRYETEEQALEMDCYIRNVLINLNIPFVEYDPVDEYDLIKKEVVNWIQEES